MGQIKIDKYTPSTPEIREKLKTRTIEIADKVILTFEKLKIEIASNDIREEDRKDFEDIIAYLCTLIDRLKDKTAKVNNLDINNTEEDWLWVLAYQTELLNLVKSLNQAIEEETVEKEKIHSTLLKMTAQYPEKTSILAELDKIEKGKKPGSMKVSRDLWESQIKTAGDTLELITDEKIKEDIRSLQSKGVLLNGSLEGLTGGTAYFKIFTIALAQTLNEQVKYFNTEEDWSGVPEKLLQDLTKGEVEIKSPIKIKNEKRVYPYILLNYKDQVRKIRGEVKEVGGKDIEEYRKYLDEVKEKQYLLDLGDTFGGVSFLTKEFPVYSKKTGKEIACICRLSPQFSKTLRGYATLRSDTIKLLGGGQQKEITMSLIDILINNRGLKDWKINKEELLSRIATIARYKIRKGEREKDFKEAVQKAKDAKILKVPGGYREEKNGGGEIISIFTFNPDYFKGEDISPDIEDQTPEEVKMS